MMDLLFGLSGEHPALPGAEILAVMEGERIPCDIVLEVGKERILVARAKTRRTDFLQRLALTKLAGELVGMSPGLSDLSSMLVGRIPPGSRVAISGSLSLARRLGAMLNEEGFVIDLGKPEFIIHLFRIGEQYLAAIDILLPRDFEKRKPQVRPYFHPTSMHPKIARAIVNLARLGKGDTILDPFCGTGGILIEAGLIGIRVMGSDIDEGMVNGCRKNLENYGLRADVKRTDAMNLDKEFSNIDAIVTDMPYGRSSFTSEKDLEKFYNEFISVAGNLLRKGKYLVIVIPNTYNPKSKDFSIIDEFSLYVHKSLTRKIFVMKKG